jgi:cell division protein FtsI/penicillin-binding protein 2
MDFRLTLILIAILIGYSFLVFHLYNLQVAHGEYYLSRASSQYSASGLLASNRGVIYFTDKLGNKIPAAINKDFPLIYAVPKAVDDPTETANRLAPMLGDSVSTIAKKLSKKDDTYELLMRKGTSEIADEITKEKLKGIYVDTVPARYYPFGEMAGQVLGFVAPNSKDGGESGRYGVEELYQNVLAGESGKTVGASIVAPKDGNDVILTIDPSIQAEAERVLNESVKKYSAKSGTVIVMEPSTGKVLALGSSPQFDPNNYSTADIGDFINTATQQVYEPGSVFKVLTMAAGIDSGKITPDTTYVDRGKLTMNGKTIQNYDTKTHGPYGRISMTTVIEHSINTGAVFAEQQTGRTTFKSYIENFGLGEKTNVGLPGELSGNLKRLSPKERDVVFATASYGQGVAVTPMEVINAISTIANGGNLMRPYIVADMGPKVIRRVISEDTAKKVTKMMVSAVNVGKLAHINNYNVAGKTGTALVPNFKTGGYTDNVINTYVGFAPAENPKFIILIKINEPVGAPLAGLSVVPYFKELAQFLLTYYNIPPDNLETKSNGSAQ